MSCAIDEVLTLRLEKARADGLDIKQIMHKVGISRESLDESDDPTFFQTDRPSSQFWNSGMERGQKVVYICRVVNEHAASPSDACKGESR